MEDIHARLLELIPEITHVEVRYAPGQGRSDPENHRRKPKPGMLLDEAAALGLDLKLSWTIGDRWRDIDYGHRAGVRSVFIDLGYHEALESTPTHTVGSIREAAAIVLAQCLP